MGEVYYMKINKSKGKVMACNKVGQVQIQIRANSELLEQVDSFTYLGSKISTDGWSKVEAGSRTAQAIIKVS